MEHRFFVLVIAIPIITNISGETALIQNASGAKQVKMLLAFNPSRCVPHRSNFFPKK
jgi:hypothetical protein